MSYWYATLQQIKDNINTEKQDVNVLLLEFAAIVSERIDSELGRDLPFFLPYRVDREILIEPGVVNSSLNALTLPGYWLEVEGVTRNGGALDVSAYPPGADPVHQLRLNGNCASWYADCAGGNGALPTVTISGVQGYRRRGGVRWKKIGVLAADITVDATTITITNNNGGAIIGENNRDFSAGCLFRIGDEYCFRLLTNAGVEVERGVHGTTAAAHSTGDPVEVFQVESNIARVVARMCGLWLARKGAYDTRGSNEIGTPIVYPGDLLAELWGVLQGYAYL